jgi:hypothetical protein
MKTQLILLLLTTSSLVRSSPVVFIVYKKQNSPPTLLSSGIIATEKYIITTKTSIAAYVTPELCAMPAINMEMMKESYKEKFCNDIQRTFFPDAGDFALLKLAQDIRFFYKVDVAMIPSIKSMEKPFDMTKNCKMVCSTRNAQDFVTFHKLEPATVTVGEGTTMDVTLSAAQKFCMSDSGLPLYCEFAVVGIFTYSGDSGKCCPHECSSLSKIKVVKTLVPPVQDLLRSKIPAVAQD